jgi:hypothetical protein
MNPDVAALPADGDTGEPQFEPVASMTGGAPFTSLVDEEKEKKPKAETSDATNSSASEAVDEGEIRNMFEKAPPHPNVVEADQKAEERKHGVEKQQAAREAAASQGNAALQSLQDAAVASLQSQSAPAIAERPGFNERALARREAAEAQGSLMPARGTSQPSPPSPDNTTRGTRGLSR